MIKSLIFMYLKSKKQDYSELGTCPDIGAFFTLHDVRTRFISHKHRGSGTSPSWRISPAFFRPADDVCPYTRLNCPIATVCLNDRSHAIDLNGSRIRALRLQARFMAPT